MERKARVIAMYLPQYHPIAENNKYWGNGFTEWTNVVQARPLFSGHYQPRLPADLGFYDLRLEETREHQAQLALDAGVEGFMYWHYWMGNGKMLLERPFKEVLTSGKPDFPFSLGWANHSWTTKTWVKGKSFGNDAMIAEQLYPGVEDYTNHFNYVLPAFQDDRYIKVENKPLFFIYDPLAIPDIELFIDTWQNLAVKAGLEGIHFVAYRNGRKSTMEKLIDKGFNAVGNLNMWEAEAKVVGSKMRRRLNSLLSWKLGIKAIKYEYEDIVNNIGSEDDYLNNSYPIIIPGYDRSARAGKQAIIYHNASPDIFGKHVDNVLSYVKDKPFDKRIVFLKSWNEWGEANYMEPDIRYGRAFLDELKKRIVC